jgi:hypothetical protein
VADWIDRTISTARCLEIATQRLSWEREAVKLDAPPHVPADVQRAHEQGELRNIAKNLDLVDHPLADDVRAIAERLEHGGSVSEAVDAIDRVGVPLAADLARMEDQLGVDLHVTWPLTDDRAWVFDEQWGAELVDPLTLAEVLAGDPERPTDPQPPPAPARELTEEEALREAEEVLGPGWSEVLRARSIADASQARPATEATRRTADGRLNDPRTPGTGSDVDRPAMRDDRGR